MKPNTHNGRTPTITGTLAFMLLGPILWALHLTAIYGSQSLLCARGMAGPVPDLIFAATAVTLGLMAVCLLAPERLRAAMRASGWPPEQQYFHERVAMLLHILSAFGVAAAGAGAFLVGPCIIRAPV